jgi:uncharacterized protein (UPF0276 family)
MIERDANIPPLGELQLELAAARRVAASALIDTCWQRAG